MVRGGVIMTPERELLEMILRGEEDELDEFSQRHNTIDLIKLLDEVNNKIDEMKLASGQVTIH